MKPIATTEDDLLTLVTEYDGTITGLCTADVAGWILRLNTGNRSVKKSLVRRFSNILERGQWVNTGEPIIVSREGILNDGQHRLTAIHETGIAAICDIRFGIAREAFTATGTGSKRSAADVLDINGVQEAKRCAAIAKIVWHYDAGSISYMSCPLESADIVDTLKKFPIIQDIANFNGSLRFQAIKAAWFGGLLALVCRRSTFDETREFASSVDDGQGAETSPTRRYHERLVNDAMSHTKLRTIDRLVLGVKTWNAWVANRPMTVLRVQDSERTSAGFPPIASTHDVPSRGRLNTGQKEMA